MNDFTEITESYKVFVFLEYFFEQIIKFGKWIWCIK